MTGYLKRLRRVLLIAPAGFGGIQSWCLQFGSDLSRVLDLQVTVLFEYYNVCESTDFSHEEPDTDIEIEHFYYDEQDNRAKVCERLEAIIEGYDLVYPNTSGIAYQAIGHLGPRRPIAIGACHGHFEHDYEILARFSPYLDRIFAVSRMTRNHILERLPKDHEHLLTAISPSVPIGKRWQEKTGPIRLTFAGRFDKIKNLSDIVNIAAILQKHKLDFELVLAGDGPFRPELERMIKERDLTDCAFIPGYLDNEKLSDLLATTHFIFLVSDQESFGLSAVEGMAHGAVPIVTNTCGCSEVIRHRKNGILVQVHEISAMASAVEKISHDRETWQAFSDAAVHTVEKHYDPEYILKKHLHLIEDALEHHREHAPTTPISIYSFSRLDRPFMPNFATRFLRGLKQGKKKAEE